MNDATHSPAAAHPSAAKLAAYHAGELAPAEVEAIQRHLAECRACIATLLDLPRFYERMEAATLGPPGTDGIPTAAETAAAWETLAARLGAELPPAEGARVAPPLARPAEPARPAPAPTPRGTSRRAVYALAAGLAACLVGFPAWIATHATETLQAVYPAGGGEIRRGTAETGLNVRLDGGPAVLLVPVPDLAPRPAYRIEIRTPAGDLRLSASAALTPIASPAGAGTPAPPRAGAPHVFAVVLLPGDLPAGAYRLRVLGIADGHAEVLAEHPLRAVAP